MKVWWQDTTSPFWRDAGLDTDLAAPAHCSSVPVTKSFPLVMWSVLVELSDHR